MASGGAALGIGTVAAGTRATVGVGTVDGIGEAIPAVVAPGCSASARAAVPHPATAVATTRATSEVIVRRRADVGFDVMVMMLRGSAGQRVPSVDDTCPSPHRIPRATAGIRYRLTDGRLAGAGAAARIGVVAE